MYEKYPESRNYICKSCCVSHVFYKPLKIQEFFGGKNMLILFRVGNCSPFSRVFFGSCCVPSVSVTRKVVTKTGDQEMKAFEAQSHNGPGQEACIVSQLQWCRGYGLNMIELGSV